MACETGLPVIYDFRHADMEAGGQGAPLAPVYHQILLRQAGLAEPAGFLNLGGVANLTVCSGDDLLGFDTGPANGLMDAVCQQQLGLAFDKDGTLAAAGTPARPLFRLCWLTHGFANPGRAHWTGPNLGPICTTLTSSLCLLKTGWPAWRL